MMRNVERWSEIEPFAMRALALAPKEEATPDFLLRAALMRAASAVYAGERLTPRRGLLLLKPWFGRSTFPEFTGWILSDMAKYAFLNGQMTLALELAQQAVREAGRSSDPTEAYLRRMDYGPPGGTALRGAGAVAGTVLDLACAVCRRYAGSCGGASGGRKPL
jgi:hypothetical protein